MCFQQCGILTSVDPYEPAKRVSCSWSHIPDSLKVYVTAQLNLTFFFKKKNKTKKKQKTKQNTYNLSRDM